MTPEADDDAQQDQGWGCPMTGAALVLSVVDTCTGELHLVPIEIAARHRHSGRYPTLCGARVAAASLTTQPARHCRICAKRIEQIGRDDPRRESARTRGAVGRWPGGNDRHRARHG
jgi:hypothetical protein